MAMGIYDGERLLCLSQDKKVIAIGEIGLDYYYSADNKALQQTVFADQIRIANEVDARRKLKTHLRISLTQGKLFQNG